MTETMDARRWYRPATWTGRQRSIVAVLLIGAIGVFGYQAYDAWDREFRGAPISRMLRVEGPYNGFDVSNASISEMEIQRGGPPRDGIPAILKPKFVGVDAVDFLQDSDQVLGFIDGDEARAYPLRILVWHEIANDTVGDTPIAATYCPLCGTAMVFDRQVGGKTRTFGVSGLLYLSDVLMYDHQSESLWSQLEMKAVSGELVGTELEWLPSRQMSWRAWKAAYPDSLVLSTDTGFERNYGGEAYATYKQTDAVMFPVPQHRDELRNKAWVVGVVVDGQAKAYSLEALRALTAPFEDEIGGTQIIVSHSKDADSVEVTTVAGELLPSVRVYWFAWQAFYPDTLLYAGDA